jgi:ankyrin repeat protein
LTPDNSASTAGGSARRNSACASTPGATARLIAEKAEEKKSAEFTTLGHACADGDIDQIKDLARRGMVWRVEYSPFLSHAVRYGKLEVMRCLVDDLGADVNQADEFDLTLLILAAGYGNLAVIRCLLTDLGADVDRGTQQGATALHFAVQKGNLAVIRCLVMEYGADINLANRKGLTPLYLAAKFGHLAVVRCLVMEFGTDVNPAICDLPLHAAAYWGHLAVVRCLVGEFGAHVDQAGLHNCSTALFLAAGKGHHEIVANLMRHGADLSVSADLETAVDISRSFGASEKQTAYLEAKTHCSNTGCDGAGLKKCTGCKQARYCGEACQLAHWLTHKAECKESAEVKACKKS